LTAAYATKPTHAERPTITNARPSVVARTRREAKAATVAITGSTARPIVIAPSDQRP